MLDASQYMTIKNEQALNSDNAAYDQSSYKSIYDANGNLYNTNWIDTMFEDGAIAESYTQGVIVGAAISTCALSLGYMNQDGVVGGSAVSNCKRHEFHINSNLKQFNNFSKVGEQVNFIYRKNNGVYIGNQ